MNVSLKSLWITSFCMGLSLSSHAGLGEGEFLKAASKVQSAYEAHVKAKMGLKLIVNADMSDSTENAYTVRMGNIQLVKVLGGLARVHEFSEDEVVLITCHELAHTIGGQPLSTMGSTQYSSEGQSDYFAAAECFKKVFRHEDNLEKIRSLEVPAVLDLKCSERFSDDNDYAMCVRTGVAGIAVSGWMADKIQHHRPQVETPDLSVVTQTILSFPSIQCRLDTFVAGALNTARPACWFKE